MLAHVFSDASYSSPFSVEELDPKMLLSPGALRLTFLEFTSHLNTLKEHNTVRISTLLIALPLNNLQVLQHLPCYAGSVLEVF